MIDNFALGLIHLLLAIAVWKLLLRPDLDIDPDDAEAQPAPPRKPLRQRR